MSDISKCTDKKCPSRKTCHRYTAPSTAGHQSYADFNRPEQADKCEDYWPVEKQEKKP